MPESVLDAIREGKWDFEPTEKPNDEFDSTGALPGTQEKLNALALRAQQGLPLWHPHDRRTYDDKEQA